VNFPSRHMYYFGDQIKEIQLDVTCSRYGGGGGGGRDKCIEDFVVNHLEGRRRIWKLLEWILKGSDEWPCTGLIWLSVGKLAGCWEHDSESRVSQNARNVFYV